MGDRRFRIGLVCTVMAATAAGIALAGLVKGRLALRESTALIEVGLSGGRGGPSPGGAPLPLDEYRDPITDRSLFDSAPAGPGGTPGATDLPARLLATSAAAEDRYSSALITLDDQEAQVFAIGDRVADAVIEDIARRQVVLRRGDGRRELLRIQGATAAAPRKPPRPDRQPMDWSQGVEALGDGRYRIDRDTLEEGLTRLDELGNGLRVVPNFRDGRVAGYRIVKIRGDNPLRLLGLERNDVIVGMDGQPVDPSVALDRLGRAGEIDALRLQVERGGESMDLSYEVY